MVKPQDVDAAKAEDAKNDLETLKDELLLIAPSKEKLPSSPRGSVNRSSIGHYSLGPHR